MAFNPSFDALFIDTIIENCVNLIEANAADALVWAATTFTGTLDNFKVFRQHREIDKQFPFIDIVADNSLLETNEEEESITEVHRLVVDIGLLDTNPKRLARKIRAYVRAVDAILRTATDQALMTGAPANWTECILEVEAHNYDLVVKTTDDNYLGIAQLLVAVRLIEQ